MLEDSRFDALNKIEADMGMQELVNFTLMDVFHEGDSQYLIYISDSESHETDMLFFQFDPLGGDLIEPNNISEILTQYKIATEAE